MAFKFWHELVSNSVKTGLFLLCVLCIILISGSMWHANDARKSSTTFIFITIHNLHVNHFLAGGVNCPYVIIYWVSVVDPRHSIVDPRQIPISVTLLVTLIGRLSKCDPSSQNIDILLQLTMLTYASFAHLVSFGCVVKIIHVCSYISILVERIVANGLWSQTAI